MYWKWNSGQPLRKVVWITGDVLYSIDSLGRASFLNPSVSMSPVRLVSMMSCSSSCLDLTRLGNSLTASFSDFVYNIQQTLRIRSSLRSRSNSQVPIRRANFLLVISILILEHASVLLTIRSHESLTGYRLWSCISTRDTRPSLTLDLVLRRTLSHPVAKSL